MSSRIAAAPLGAAALIALALGCSVQPKPPAPPPAPAVINTFAADKTEIAAGQSVTLSWDVSNATAIEVIDQNGDQLYSGADATGSVSAKLTASSFFVLRAASDGGRDSAFAQVAVDQPLQNVFLLAVPPEVDAGKDVTLIYSGFGATKLALTDDSGAKLNLPNPEAGALTLTPARTTRYKLTATGKTAADQVVAQVTAVVHPVIASFTATPPAAKSGETITFAWSTKGAESLTLTEATFGALFASSDAQTVAGGTFAWTVPGGADAGASADGGTAAVLPQGFPFHFKLAAKTATPDYTRQAAIDSYAGDAPRIDVFDAPPAATIGKTLTLSWRTTNAARLQLYADGLLIYEPLATNPGAIALGSLTVASPTRDTTFELVAASASGVPVRQSKTVKAAKPPQALTFTASSPLADPTKATTCAWTTQDATRVQIRLQGGPVLFVTTQASKVAAGSTPILLGVDSTLVFEAVNDAGDKSIKTATVKVNAPLTFTVTPNVTVTPASVVLAWDAPLASEIWGMPSAAVSTNSPTDFYELEGSTTARHLFFTDRDNGTAKIGPLPNFSFPFVGQTVDTLYASTNGFLSLTDQGSLPSNVDLSKATNTAGAMLAPFWDDLDLTDGDVSYDVDDSSLPRKLIVQWTRAHRAGDPQSALTFQVQLDEAGVIKFAYKTLTDSSGLANGQDATIGVQLSPGTFSAQYGYNANSVSDGQLLTWFTSAQTTGQLTMAPDKTSLFTFFYKATNGALVASSARLRLFAPNSVRVNEAMPLPISGLAQGSWLELYNSTADPVDLSGLQLSTADGGTAPFVIPDGTSIAPKDYLVLGQSTDPAQNGDANVALAWGATDLPMSQDDALTLSTPETPPKTVSMLQWTGAVGGTSVQPGESAIDSAGKQLTCPHTTTFGQTGSIGTPGKANESCFGYTLSSIPVAFEDVSAIGTPLVTTNSDEAVFALSLAAAPFKYFGTAQNALTVSTNGWVVFKPETSAVFTNASAPSATSEPVGALAAFWDDLEGTSTGNVYFARLPGRWIVQWSHYTHFLGTDDLNFEVKLFDDGTVEYHYAAMTSGSTSSYGNGNSATVWLAKPDGSAAMPVSINTAGISPNTAWRFTPTAP